MSNLEIIASTSRGSSTIMNQEFKDIQKSYDRSDPVTSIFIGSTTAVGGAVNCFPRLVDSETVAPSTQSCQV